MTQLWLPGFAPARGAGVLSPKARQIYAWLSRQSAKWGGWFRRGITVTAAALAGWLSLGVRTVEKYLRALRNAGLVESIRGRHGMRIRVLVCGSKVTPRADLGADLKPETCGSERAPSILSKHQEPPSPPVAPQSEPVLETCGGVEPAHSTTPPVMALKPYDPEPSWRWFQHTYPKINNMNRARSVWFWKVKNAVIEDAIRVALAPDGLWFRSQDWSEGVVHDACRWLDEEMWWGKPLPMRSKAEREGFRMWDALERAWNRRFGT